LVGDEANPRIGPSSGCLAKADGLSAAELRDLQRQRRRLTQLIRRINKQQLMFCRPDEEKEQVPYRKCPEWRKEKLAHYQQLMQLVYCSDSSQWPSAPEERRFLDLKFSVNASVVEMNTSDESER